MINGLIDLAIKHHCPLEIVYSKDGRETRTFSLRSVAYSSKYGNGYISAYCDEGQTELTFRINKILDVTIEWVDVFPPEYRVKQDGLYLVTCRSDMHLEYELRKYNKGEDIIASYQNEDGVESSYSQDDLLAYHYIPYYTQEDRNWIRFEKNDKERKDGYYTFAYLQTGEDLTQEEKEYDWVDDYDNWVQMSDFISPWELTNTKANGINYTVSDLGIPFDKLRIPSNIKVLAYNYSSIYTEIDHRNHWDLAEELGLIKRSKR